MSTLAKAIAIAARAHVAQRDKNGGGPYVLHPLRVMNRVSGEEAKIAAVLHDVVEDTPVTEEDLRREGFGDGVLAAVLALSRREGESYTEFVVRCKANPIAREVKLADLEDDSNLPRALLREDRVAGDLRRLNRYVLSYPYLTDRLSERAYREWMERVGE